MKPRLQLVPLNNEDRQARDTLEARRGNDQRPDAKRIEFATILLGSFDCLLSKSATPHKEYRFFFNFRVSDGLFPW